MRNRISKFEGRLLTLTLSSIDEERVDPLPLEWVVAAARASASGGRSDAVAERHERAGGASLFLRERAGLRKATAPHARVRGNSLTCPPPSPEHSRSCQTWAVSPAEPEDFPKD